MPENDRFLGRTPFESIKRLIGSAIRPRHVIEKNRHDKTVKKSQNVIFHLFQEKPH